MRQFQRWGLPRFICFVGVDGSGKSTYAKNIHKTRYLWLRMNYFFARPVLLYCRLTGLTRRPVVDGQKISIHDFHKSKVISTLVQYLHFLDTAAAYFFKAFIPMAVFGKVIICDRFVHDVLIDFMMESRDFDLQNKVIAKLLFLLIPKNAKMLLLKTDIKNILQRKPDVVAYDENFEARFAVYDRLDEIYDLEVVDNNRPQRQVFVDIKQRIGILLEEYDGE